MQHILVGVDGSECGQRAVKLAGELAKATGAKLTLVHVTPSWQVPPEVSMPPEYTQLVQLNRREEGERLLEQSRSQCRAESGVVAESLVLEGNPAREMNQAAQQLKADLIVVGSRGMGPFSRLLLGSTSTKLVHLAAIPVTVVP
jgi:nucleotide-binding universal stress UspA family protein